MIHVYFQDKKDIAAVKVAIFADEEIYSACLPALEALAEKDRMHVTESVGSNNWLEGE